MAVVGSTYGASVLLTVGAPPSDEARMAALVAELTAGAGVLVPGEDRWVDRA